MLLYRCRSRDISQFQFAAEGVYVKIHPTSDKKKSQATYPPGSLPFNFETRGPWYFYNESKEILPGKTSGAKYLPVINGHLVLMRNGVGMVVFLVPESTFLK